MKKQNAKLNVAPPVAYKVPSLPTLTALGVAATTLMTGYTNEFRPPLPGLGPSPVEIGIETRLGGKPPMPRMPLPKPKALPCQYRVGSTEGGDTLSGIAKIFYGDASKWPAIHEANKALIKNPDVIRDGMLITIPKLGE
ncbi:MAG: hypothetical protein FWH21_05350 [Kiritimatiellaeota bacterium]|nr:hypothetical protein [Kiritimatiellota bacterium]